MEFGTPQFWVAAFEIVISVAGAAKGSLILLVFGLVVSIPLVVVGTHVEARAFAGAPRPSQQRQRPVKLAA